MKNIVQTLPLLGLVTLVGVILTAGVLLVVRDYQYQKLHRFDSVSPVTVESVRD